MAKQRKMSEGEISTYIAEMQTNVGAKLDEIKALLPNGYVLTLVARIPDVEDADLLFTNDGNLEAVVKAVSKQVGSK